MDEIDIDMCTVSTVSEESVCETALPYVSDAQTMTCLENSTLSETTNLTDEDNRLLRELQDYVAKERRQGEHIPLLINHTDLKNFFSLKTWLRFECGPFPLHSHHAATIIKDIASALLALHSLKLCFGPSLLEATYLDKEYRGHLLLEHAPHSSKVLGHFSREDDMFRLGEILYRLVTGKEVRFNKDKVLEPLPKQPYKIDQTGLKLAYSLLSCYPKYRPTAGGVIHNPWPTAPDARCITFLV